MFAVHPNFHFTGGILNFETGSSNSSQILPDITGNKSMIGDDDGSLISAVADAQSVSTVSSTQVRDRGRKQSSTADMGKQHSRHALQTISEYSVEQSSLDTVNGGKDRGKDGKKKHKKKLSSTVSKKIESKMRVSGKSSDMMTARNTVSQLSMKQMPKQEKKEVSHDRMHGCMVF